MTIVDYTRPRNLRFYPKSIPPFPYEPTQEKFRIRQIDNEQGQGVVSLVSFNAGDIVFAFTGFFSSEVTQFSLQIGSSLHLHDPYFYGKIIHSCDPNCIVDTKKRQFVASRQILIGDLITMDYAQTEDFLFKTFPCQCHSKNCRGLVFGKKQIPTGVGLESELIGVY